jgi:enoyl-[acyl-carrier protein] reductase II
MNRITQLLGINYPIIQAGMIWCSGWELASAVSNAGGLGVIGAGSMYPAVLEAHIIKCKAATTRPFAVNLPLIYPDIEQHIKIILDQQVPVVITSAGSPKKYTAFFKSNGIKVVHVVAGSKFAVKCEEAGVDAIVAEGFEAGGHNGADETTTMVLLPQVKRACNLPLIAAGGIATGQAMLAAFALGAEGVQVGSRFVASIESSAHPLFKQSVLKASEGDTKLHLKQLVPVRLLQNSFKQQVEAAELKGASAAQLLELLGHGRAKKGMFEGDLEQGELEIGQVSALIEDILPASQIVQQLVDEFNEARLRLLNISL